MEQSRPVSSHEWLGTVVIDGQHYPTSLVYRPAGGGSATIEVASLPREAAASLNRRVAFDVPLATPVGKLLALMVQAITGGRPAASLSVSVGAIVPAHHDCDAIVVDFSPDPMPLAGARRLAATVRLAGAADGERFEWADDVSLGEWLARLDVYCRRPHPEPGAEPADADLASCGSGGAAGGRSARP
jgi:hypothetical protein